MSTMDRTPLHGTPSTDRLLGTFDNRLGAVYQAMHSFWLARAHAHNGRAVENRRDAYSAILFNSGAARLFTDDFQSTPDELLTPFLYYHPAGGTNFNAALEATQQVVDEFWSAERLSLILSLRENSDAYVQS